MAKVTVSIIIPTLERPSLQDVLDGIKACEGYEDIVPEILVTKNKTTSRARNKGLDHASGDIIVFLGDDTIPKKDWLQKVVAFHETHPEPEAVLLGKVSWPEKLAADPFHQWLEQNAQFQWQKLKKQNNSYHFFYTSNISLKKSFIDEEHFSDDFVGWGFEDTEFGYRLSKKGMQLFYDETCEVLHDHEQTLEGVIKNTKLARKNAEIFEKLHPEVNILPRGLKKIILQITLILSWPFQFLPRVRWWRKWKKAWANV